MPRGPCDYGRECSDRKTFPFLTHRVTVSEDNTVQVSGHVCQRCFDRLVAYVLRQKAAVIRYCKLDD